MTAKSKPSICRGIATFAFALCGIVRADEWPEFRGPTGQGLSTATNVPVTWSATNSIAWRTGIPGRGWSSPVLSRGLLYLTTALSSSNGAPDSLRALCLSAAQGRILWNVEVLQPESSAAKVLNPKNSLASPTPLVHGDRLYVHFGHLGTAALDRSGQVLWRQTEVKYPPYHGNGGSPILVGDLLVFSADGERDPFVVALDAHSGKVRWKTPRKTSAQNPFSFSTPLAITVDRTPQIISAGSGIVGAYAPADGHQIWCVRYDDGFSVVPRPVFAHGLVLINSGFFRPILHAIRPAGARGDVTDTHVAWRITKGAPLTPSPLVVGDELYFVSDAGIATCADARTGKVCWNERLGGDFSASPVYAEGRVYFQNEAGVGFVVRHGTTFERLAKNELGERTLASYAVANHALFIRSESHLWRIGEPPASADTARTD